MQTKSVIIGALLIAAAQLTLVAQRGGHGLPIEQMKDALELSQAQVDQLEQIRSESRELVRALRQDETMNRDSMRVKMRALHAVSREKVHAVLTPEQRSKFMEKRKEYAPGFDRKRGTFMDDRKEMDLERRKRMKRNQAEIRAYRDTHVLPVLRAQRAKLDEKLAIEDRERIDALRRSLDEKREAMRLERQSMRKQGEKPGPDDLKEMREGRRNSEEMQEARALAEKYRDDIDGLFAEVEDQRNEWRSEIREIRQSGMSEGTGKKGVHRHRAIRGKHGRKHRGDRPERPSMDERKEKRAAGERARFLLLDPEGNPGSTGKMSTGYMVSRVEAFPNPAADVLNLSFELESPVQAKVELRDETGNLVKDLPARFFEKGAASVRMDLEGVPTGAYSVVVIPEGGKPQITRVVVNK